MNPPELAVRIATAGLITYGATVAIAYAICAIAAALRHRKEVRPLP